MKISREWLQTYFDSPLPESAAIGEALTFHAFEIESIENDVLDVKVTANRGHDCLSHRGIAKELGAILNISMKGDVLRSPLSLEPKTDAVAVSIKEPSLCNRYVAGYVRGVKVGPSPEWLRSALESIGQRSINNIVDATNYVMFGLGQPLHAFDASELRDTDGKYSIDVRKARVGEKMMALDNKEYEFTDSMLLIVDANVDVAVGIAGVKGGAPAGVSEETTDIIIESANFDGVSVRRTAAALKLRTDASSRFEQKISPELAGYGMKAIVALITELAGGELAGYVDEYPVTPEKRTVSVTLAHVNALLGTTLAQTEVSAALSRLDLAHAQSGDAFEVYVPFERLDMTIPEDVIEEVGRIIGYDTIPAVELPALAQHPTVNTAFVMRERVREFLMNEGFSEVFTSVFAEKGERVIANKVDGVKPYLRAELMTGLRDALDRNTRNKDLLGESQVKIFEIGTAWRDGGEIEMLALAVEKVKKQKSASDYLAALAESMGTKSEMAPEEVLEIPLAELGNVTSDSYDNLPASQTARYQTFSKYPFIVRDVAFWVNGEVDEQRIRALIEESAGDLLVRLDRFDRFEKEGRVSYAFRLVFQSPDRTLFEGDAGERMESVSAALTKEGFEIR